MATTATYGTLSASEHSANLRKAVIASTIGTTIEWYDFFIYGTAERNNATQGRSEEFRATSRAAPQHGAAIVGNRLASLQRDSGHHRQAQRGRHEHRAALASKPAAAFRVRPVPRSGAPMYLAFVRLGKELRGCVPLLGAFAPDMVAGPARDRSNRQSASSPTAESFSSRVPRSRGQRSLRDRASPRIRAPDARILGSAEATPAFRAHRCPMASPLAERSMAWRAAFRKYSMAFSVSPA
jgi:hypothetical protein